MIFVGTEQIYRKQKIRPYIGKCTHKIYCKKHLTKSVALYTQCAAVRSLLLVP